MIRSLHIENYVLIDSLDIVFPEGLSIITGQTGAGKSILLGALSLLTGAKGDASLILGSAQSCVVEGEFELVPGIKEILEENEVDCDGDDLVIRRVLNRSGRSRSFVNDSPVPVQVLSDIAASLIDIHSQHQSLKLADRRFQMEVLDSYAGNGAMLQECRELWGRIQELSGEIDSLRERLSRQLADREYNAAQFRQLDDARLRDGELEELEAEQKQLANAESIKEAFAGVRAVLEPEEGLSPDSAMREAERMLSKLEDIVPGTGDLAGRLRSVRIELSDISDTAASMDEKVSLSQERLEQVEDRMSLLYSLMQKHSCSDIAALIKLRDALSESLFDTDSLEEKISALRNEREKLREKHLEVCACLHGARAEAAPRLAEGIEKSLHYLELDRAVFSVGVKDSQPGPTGADEVEFGFSAAGGAPVDVAKCASGGEISRIMLSLKALMAEFRGMPTMIFDEIDTGVSGSAADKMGGMICRMGGRMQVIAITHLPQVAAKGSAHFVVEKSSGASSALSSVRRLGDDERVGEIARLLSGSTVTPEAIANARSLLGLAHKES